MPDPGRAVPGRPAAAQPLSSDHSVGGLVAYLLFHRGGLIFLFLTFSSIAKERREEREKTEGVGRTKGKGRESAGWQRGQHCACF